MNPVVELIDIGANLGNNSFERDLQQVLARAATAGVSRIIVTGTSISTSHRALELAHDNPGRLFATIGIHPHEAEGFCQQDLDGLRQLAIDPVAVAIGETGLDFYRNFSSVGAQEKVFIAQLQLAAETSLPVFLHERDALQRQIEILKEFRGSLGKTVTHCFTGGPDALNEYLSLDHYIGITGWLCDERRGQALRQAAREIPDARIMIESDAPYLLPRGTDFPSLPNKRRNEPCTLPVVLDALAGLRDQDPRYLAERIRQNTMEFFGIPEMHASVLSEGQSTETIG